MASQAYDPFIKTMMAPGNASNGHSGATIDLLASSAIKVALVDTTGGYTVDDEHDYIADLSTHILADGQSSALTSTALVDITGGGVAFDAADLQMTSVGDGTETLDAIVLYDDTVTTPSADALICYIDTGTGFGVLPNESTIDITWDSGNNRIFSFGA